jgi:phosphatidylglycerophosphatase C
MKAGIALFDFDGTISNADSATLFYKSLYKYRITFLFRHFLLCMPEFIKYRCGFTDYVTLKRKRLQIHVGALSEERYQNQILHFQLILLPSIVKESALKRIAWHKAQKHDIWVVSASFDFLLSNWCEQLDIMLLVNKTRKEQGNCFFEGDDCNYIGKFARIRNNIKLTDYTRVYAYGDSDGDKAMLSMAHEPHFKYFI